MFAGNAIIGLSFCSRDPHRRLVRCVRPPPLRNNFLRSASEQPAAGRRRGEAPAGAAVIPGGLGPAPWVSMSDVEHLVDRTIASISQSDPLIKLLEQVRLGRMNRSDPGLRVITDTWVATYRKAVATPGLSKQALRRIDPTPRLDLLAQEGMLPVDHAAARQLLADFQQAIERASV